MVYSDKETSRRQVVDVISVKRNPYLVDYENHRRKRTDTQQRSRAGKKRRRQFLRLYKIKTGTVIFGIVLIVVLCLLGHNNTAAVGSGRTNSRSVMTEGNEGISVEASLIQGIPAAEFKKHPAWTENFLTLNEYSRPGERLPEVTNIFVHYTANPGTSAAQNHSYFERQKDEHLASVSSHFIIGYEGEIIQCVPLDEIAYAVQTRNYDSVSIECCYKAADGSFTRETYDSLISLLVWLTDIYDLNSEDILRHYDCGGKKCPLYYTEHPDAWERLKEDVEEAIG